MASSSKPRIYQFLADASISSGKAVKLNSTDGQHVTVGSANTDACIGLAQNTPTASGEKIEVALQGGGAKGLLGETVSAGQPLVSHTDGSLVLPNASGDKIVARAMQDGVSGDIIAVEVIDCFALAGL